MKPMILHFFGTNGFGRAIRLVRLSLFSARVVTGWVLLLSLSACTRDHSFKVTDVANTNEFNLVSRHGAVVSGIFLHFSGRLDGTALVFVSDSPTQTLTGRIDCKIHHHLQGSNFVLHYLPEKVRGGHIAVDYHFY